MDREVFRREKEAIQERAADVGIGLLAMIASLIDAVLLLAEVIQSAKKEE